MKSIYSKPQDVNLSRETCRRIQEVMTARKISFSDFVTKAIQEQLDKAEAIPFLWIWGLLSSSGYENNQSRFFPGAAEHINEDKSIQKGGDDYEEESICQTGLNQSVGRSTSSRSTRSRKRKRSAFRITSGKQYKAEIVNS